MAVATSRVSVSTSVVGSTSGRALERQLSPPEDERLLYARLLVALGEHEDAERELGALLQQDPRDLGALSLFAKIKHTRGELSQAIACWSQIESQATRESLASLGGSIGTGTGQRHALEEWRLYKLAVLANAWLAEASGDLGGACTLLEQLGRERGFETDGERMLALARVYEEIGSPESLEKAVRIFLYLEHTSGMVPALGRLSALYQKIGDFELAKKYEHRHGMAFRRRMHRLSRADVATVAALRFIPLHRIRRLSLPADPQARAMSERAMAIHAFLDGDTEVAKRALLGFGTLLDEKYIAEIELLQGDSERGVAGLLELMKKDPDDARMASLLLEKYAQSQDGEIATVMRSPEIAERQRRHLEDALRTSPLRSATWRDMAILHCILGQTKESERHSMRAAALEVAHHRDTHTVGRVLAAAVLNIGKKRGIIHQIWADRYPVKQGTGGHLAVEDVLGNMTADMKQDVRNIFLSTREYARSRFPHLTSDIMNYSYFFKLTKEDEPSGGLSAGLPTAIAFLSVFLQRAVPQDAAFSGVVIADAHDVLVVRKVDEVVFKVKGAYHRSLRVLALPAENRADLVHAMQVPAVICDEMVRFVRSLDDAVVLTFGEDIWTA